MAEIREKLYVSDNAQLMAEWDWIQNNELGFAPGKLTCGSEKKVWWKCSKGHCWQATINNRNNGNGCPYCARRLSVKGKNDLLTINPILVRDWNNGKNGALKPEEFLTKRKYCTARLSPVSLQKKRPMPFSIGRSLHQ